MTPISPPNYTPPPNYPPPPTYRARGPLIAFSPSHDSISTLALSDDASMGTALHRPAPSPDTPWYLDAFDWLLMKLYWLCG